MCGVSTIQENSVKCQQPQLIVGILTYRPNIRRALGTARKMSGADQLYLILPRQDIGLVPEGVGAIPHDITLSDEVPFGSLRHFQFESLKSKAGPDDILLLMDDDLQRTMVIDGEAQRAGAKTVCSTCSPKMTRERLLNLATCAKLNGFDYFTTRPSGRPNSTLPTFHGIDKYSGNLGFFPGSENPFNPSRTILADSEAGAYISTRADRYNILRDGTFSLGMDFNAKNYSEGGPRHEARVRNRDLLIKECCMGEMKMFMIPTTKYLSKAPHMITTPEARKYFASRTPAVGARGPVTTSGWGLDISGPDVA